MKKRIFTYLLGLLLIVVLPLFGQEARNNSNSHKNEHQKKLIITDNVIATQGKNLQHTKVEKDKTKLRVQQGKNLQHAKAEKDKTKLRVQQGKNLQQTKI